MLGYDGIPWTELYPQLLEAELPIWIGSTFGSTDTAMRHAMLISAGMNWHLFETIDIRRQATDEIVHLATDVLRVTPRRPAQCSIRGNEQLRIPGVPMPDHGARDFITFGIFESTSIGYIYVASWSFDPADRISEQFEEAIRTLMFERDTAGLIIDYRQNTGGSMLEAHDGYSLLFDTAIRAVAFDVRGDPNDHLSMVPHRTFTAGRFVIPGDPSSSYDRPIAVLTGPGAWSNGDWESLRTRFHPRARVFGKPTNGAFTPFRQPEPGAGLALLPGNRQWLSDLKATSMSPTPVRRSTKRCGCPVTTWLPVATPSSSGPSSGSGMKTSAHRSRMRHGGAIWPLHPLMN